MNASVTPNRLFAWLLLPTLILFALPASAQETAQPNGAAATPVTTDQLRDLRQTVRSTQTRLTPRVGAIDPSTAEAWLAASPAERLAERAEATADNSPEQALWLSALEHEQAGTERLRGALERVDLALAAPERLGQVERRLVGMLEAASRPAVPSGTSITDIEGQIAAVDRQRKEIALQQEQKAQTLTRLEEQQRGMQEAFAPLQQPNGTGTEEDIPLEPLTDATLADALEAYLRAQDRRVEARLLSARLDLETVPLRIELLQTELAVLAVETAWLAERQRQLVTALSELSGAELRDLRDDVRRLRERDPQAADFFQAEINELLQRVDQIAQTQARARELREARDRYAYILEDVSQTLESVRERLDVGGLTETLGGLFLEEERRLQRLGDLDFALRKLERELSQSRLRDISLRDELRLLSLAPAIVEDDPARAELRRLQAMVIEMQLQADSQLTEELRQNESRLRVVVQQVDALSQILRESLLWWPSHSALGREWSKRIPLAVASFLQPGSWQEIRVALAAITVGSPASLLLTLLVAGGLFVAGRRTPEHLDRLAEKTRHRFSDRIGLTVQAIGWSLLRALPVPVLLAASAHRLQQLPEIGPGVEILSAVFFSLSVWWLAGHLLLLISSRNGIGTVHFAWNPVILRRLRRHLAWFLPSQLLVLMVITLSFGHPSDDVRDVFGRMALLAAALLSGWFTWRMLAPFPDPSAAPNADRKRRMARLALTAFALGLALLTLAGYLLTVGEMLQRAINTGVVLAAVWLGYSLAARALVLSEARLQLQRMREQRAKAAVLETAAQVGEGAVIDVPEPHLSLENINLQTRTLLRVTTGAAVVLALFWVWADILPALTWLERVTLWSRTIVVGETEILSRVSLQDFMLAIFLGVLFTLAARNLPGLVEILLSRSTRMDAAGRYTITTLLRYLLAVVAVISVFSLLGLRWSELQWMVAALTLGLGFGLQEVVANFVSGIIMLFERPVRVGDTITIGEYSGTVTKIRTRATTIMDWDNREIVVPNKTFITERLINWTLSDTMTRIVIPVGVSYDADVDAVIATLGEVAGAHPTVMTDPAPSVLFLSFGDSTLNFELRIYVSQMKERLVTVSDLHRAIIREFRKKGIEIAYPQMDLHVRDMVPITRAEAGVQRDGTSPGSAPGT